MTCTHCSGPMVTLSSISQAICNDCKIYADIPKQKTDSARARKRSMRLGDKQHGN